jgi:hypothetical protein
VSRRHSSSPPMSPTNPADVALARRTARLEMALELSHERRRRDRELSRLSDERRNRARQLELAEMKAKAELRTASRYSSHRRR